MPESTTLAERIDAEFKAADLKLKQFQQQQLDKHHERQQRFEKLEKVFDAHRDVWGPRLETLAHQFGDRIKMTPRIVPGLRQATFEVSSELAHVVLRFSATSDDDVRQIVFQYSLEIWPILMNFESQSELRLPIDNVDRQALGQWVDDRIMSFVHTYLEMYENVHYLKSQLVDDPVAKVHFPKFAAAAKLDVNGKTIYFISDETRRQYEKQTV